MTDTMTEIDERSHTFEDLFGDRIAVAHCGYENHRDIGPAEGVSIQGCDVRLPLIFSPAEARRLAAALLSEAEAAESNAACRGLGGAAQ